MACHIVCFVVMQVSHNNLMQARLMPGIEVFVGFDARPALVKFSDETTCIATHRNGQACR